MAGCDLVPGPPSPHKLEHGSVAVSTAVTYGAVESVRRALDQSSGRVCPVLAPRPRDSASPFVTKSLETRSRELDSRFRGNDCILGMPE